MALLCILQGVQFIRYAALNMDMHQSLKTLHNHCSESYWPIVSQASWWALLGKGDDPGGFEADGDSALIEGGFKYRIESTASSVTFMVGEIPDLYDA